MTRSSLFSAVRLARVVQRVKARLRPGIHKIKALVNEQDVHTLIQAEVAVEAQRLFLPRPLPSVPIVHAEQCFARNRTTNLDPQSDQRCQGLEATTVKEGAYKDISRALEDIDSIAPLKDGSLRSIASQDRLLLRWKLRDSQHSWKQRELQSLLKSIALAFCLVRRSCHCTDANGHIRIALPRTSYNQKCPNDNEDIDAFPYQANLVHLLLSLHKMVSDALLHTLFELVLANVLFWYHTSVRTQAANYDWFSEWPNSQHPLSTTWPYNIKPSLMVLWGVCWQFVMYTNHKPQSRGGSRPVWTRQATASHRSSAPVSQPLLSSAWYSATSFPNEAEWDVPSFTASDASNRYTSLSESPSHLTAHLAASSDSAATYLLSDQVDSTLPTRQPSLTNYLDNIYGATNFQTDSLSGSFADLWPSYSASDYTSALVPSPSSSSLCGYLDTGILPQTVTSTPNETALSSRNTSGGPAPLFDPSVLPSSVPSQEFLIDTFPGPFDTTYQRSRRNMQDYPSPQPSDASGPASSTVCPIPKSGSAANTLPVFNRSPPCDSRSLSPREYSVLYREPLRNVAGTFYCDHAECSDDRPIFTRKCEWTKHMDKHTRPYVCEEPECENIRGFTYSGGLLRHKREVHRMMGGPRASCMCPHKDCKRSTGVGFSRKENLHEHLRRVHRGIGLGQSGPHAIPAPSAPFDIAKATTVDVQAGPPARTSQTILHDRPIEHEPGSQIQAYKQREAQEDHKRKRDCDSKDLVPESPDAEGDNPDIRSLQSQVRDLHSELRNRDDQLRALKRRLDDFVGH